MFMKYLLTFTDDDREAANLIYKFVELERVELELKRLADPAPSLAILGVRYLELSHSLLDVFIASGQNISVILPVFQRALDLLPQNCKLFQTLLFQCAIALDHLGYGENSLSYLEDALSLEKKYPEIKDETWEHTPLSFAINAFWPAPSGGVGRITGINVFNSYSDSLTLGAGLARVSEFWWDLKRQLPMNNLICPLHVHVRMRLMEYLFHSAQYTEMGIIFNEALRCFEESGLRMKDYEKFADSLSRPFHLLRSEETLGVMHFIKPKSAQECKQYIDILNEPESLGDTYEKRIAASILCKTADIIVGSTDEVLDLERACHYWKITTEVIRAHSPTKAFVNQIKVILTEIDLCRDDEAAAVFRELLINQEKFGFYDLRLIKEAHNQVRRYHHSFRINSKVLPIYREWYSMNQNADTPADYIESSKLASARIAHVCSCTTSDSML